MRVKKKTHTCKICQEPCYGNSYCGDCYTRKAQLGRTPWNKGKTTGIIPKTAFQKGVRFNPSGEFKPKESPAYKMIKNYKSIHYQINKMLGRANRCDQDGTHESERYHWANKSGEYKLESSDWIPLCPKCHYRFDHR